MVKPATNEAGRQDPAAAITRIRITMIKFATFRFFIGQYPPVIAQMRTGKSLAAPWLPLGACAYR